MKIYYLSETGNVRSKNEDLLLINDEILQGIGIREIEYQDHLIAIVADGMGGYDSGEIASKILLECFVKKKPISEDEIISILKEAREKIYRYSKEKNINLGSAIAGIIKIGDDLKIFNVGDCRVYRILFEKVIQLSKDHSLAQKLVEDGVLEKNQAKKDKRRNILTSAITSDLEEFEAFLNQLNLLNKDKIIICSDGFWEEFEEDFLAIFMSENPLEKTKEISKTKILKDNYSYIYVEI